MKLLDSPLVEASVRAVWTPPLIGEEGAPPHRIIHSLAVRFPHPAEVRRIGIRAAPGFFKCGSHADPDWITSLRVLRYRRWDGAASGYEGLLTDQFGVIGLALERFRCLHRS